LVKFGTAERDGTSIEMNWGEFTGKDEPSYLGSNLEFTCKRTPQRAKLGYNGLHVDFRTQEPDAIGVELQVYGKKQYEEYMFGTPSHIIFKAIDSGILGRLSDFYKIPFVGRLLGVKKPDVLEIADTVLKNFRDLRYLLEQSPKDASLRANSVIRLRQVWDQIYRNNLDTLLLGPSSIQKDEP
jgi:hypothetical protein